MNKFIGWRMWFWDGSSVEGETWEDAVSTAEQYPDDVLVRMLYYEGGGTQIQQGMDYYFVAPHPSGEYVYGTSNDLPETIIDRYPGVIIQSGKWAPDDFYRKIVSEAVSTKTPPCGDCN
jgi:hypothetical protein